MKLIGLYKYLFLFAYGSYLYLNKAIAYTYLSELVWLLGILLFIKYFKQLNIAWGKVLGILTCLLLVNGLQLLRGFAGNGVVDTIRDSFVLNYGGFVFIAFLFWDQQTDFFNKIVKLYQYFPMVVSITYFIKSIYPDINDIELFKGIPLLLYKNGDMSVHLLITVMLVLTGKLTWNNQRLTVANYILLIYLFLLTATYSRGGLLAFTLPLGFFVFRSRKSECVQNIKMYFKWIPLVIALALPLYLSTKIKVEDKDYGRQVGLSQLRDNVVSIFVRDAAKSTGDLDDNVTWRLLWWGKIIDYTVYGPYFYTGKGLGVSLADDDDINTDDSLRSPDNFSLTILARYGVPIFLVWLLFLFYLFQPLFQKKQSAQTLLLGSALLGIFINASFDVSLEGPMMAFPFWSLLGIYLMEQIKVHE